MIPLVARTGRHQQRYEDGHRLLAGCIPYRCGGGQGQDVEVLLITPRRSEGLQFPKGGWETDETVEEAAVREAVEEAGVRGVLEERLGVWDFQSKRPRGELCPEGLCRAHVFALAVTEQLEAWPEEGTRRRRWVPLADAPGQCRVGWMRQALATCVDHLAAAAAPPIQGEDEDPGSQIELQVRRAEASASDASALLPSAAPRSEDFTLGLGPAQSPAYMDRSRSISKMGDDVSPLLADPSSSGEGEEKGAVERGKKKGAGLRSAVFNLSTTIIGAGIMALPAAMRVLGVIPGTVMICVMGFLSEASLEMVVRYTTQLKAWTYGGMVEGAWGGTGRRVAQIAIVVNNGGILIVYMIIMGDVLAGSDRHVGLFEGWADGRGWWTNRSVMLLLTMVLVLAPLSSLKRIDSLEISSAISVALALVFVVLSAGIAATKLVEGKLAAPRMYPSFSSRNVVDLLTVVPIMTNAFVCQFNVPPIYAELAERTPPRMNRVGRISIGLCVAVYTLTALSGYLLFGDSTESDVLSNFDTDLGISHSGFWDDAVRVGYVVHLFLVFPVIHFSFRENVDLFFFSGGPPLQDSNLRFALLTLFPLMIIYVGSTLIPNIWVAFKFTGATTGLLLGFMFPSLVAIKVKGGSKAERKLAWAILFVAAIVSVVGVTTQIYSLAVGKS